MIRNYIKLGLLFLSFFLFPTMVFANGGLRANILSYAMSFFLMLPIYIMLHGILRI